MFKLVNLLFFWGFTICFSINCSAQIKFDIQNSFDFGTIQVTNIAIEKRIHFENVGMNTINIVKAWCNSGPVSVVYSQEPIKPKQKSALTISVKPSNANFAGEKYNYLYIKTSDGNLQRFKIKYTISAMPASKRKENNIFITYSNGKYGVEDLNGKVIIKNDYENVYLCNGYYICKKNDKFYIFSNTGQFCNSFIGNKISIIRDGNILITENNQYNAIYSYNGKCIIPYSDRIKVIVNRQRANIEGNDIYSFENKSIGQYIKANTEKNEGLLLNQKGQIVFRFKYPSAIGVKVEKDFSPFYVKDRFFVVVDGKETNIRNLYVLNMYIDGKGKLVQTILSGGSPFIDYDSNLKAYCFLKDGAIIKVNLNTFAATNFKHDNLKEAIININDIPRCNNPIMN